MKRLTFTDRGDRLTAEPPGALIHISPQPGGSLDDGSRLLTVMAFRGIRHEMDPSRDTIAAMVVLPTGFKGQGDARRDAKRIASLIYAGWSASDEGAAFIAEWWPQGDNP